jgi:hypothetical protein
MAEGLARDLILLALGQKDYVQHLVLSDALEKSLASFSGETDDKAVALLRLLKLIAQGKEYLSANVNPRLVLVQLLINL